ncbi:MAG: hypothetical protein L6V81_08315 [Clostridium sp.]|nr:MAG: hypothetical protein L6V81_08315 [Clostridium sp.]
MQLDLQKEKNKVYSKLEMNNQQLLKKYPNVNKILESTNPNNLNSKECLALIEILKKIFLNQKKYIELEEMFFKGQYEMLYTLNRMNYFDKDIDNKS